MLTPVVLVTCSAIAIATAAEVQPANARFKAGDRWVPQDEAATDASFLAFRAELRRSLERCDVQAVLRVLHEKVLVRHSAGDGGLEGADALKRLWGLDSGDPQRAQELCAALRHTLSLPAVQEGPDGFCAPYYACDYRVKLDDEAEDILDIYIVVRDDLEVHASPSESSEVVGRLSYEIVRMPGSSIPEGPVPMPEGWVSIATPQGKLGFVRREDVGTVLDIKAGFEKSGGQWRLTRYVGDLP